MENKKKEWYKLKFELTQMKTQMSDDKKGLAITNSNQLEDLVNDYFNVGDKFVYEVDTDRGHVYIKSKVNDWSAESITLDIRSKSVYDEDGNQHQVEYLRLDSTRLNLELDITDNDRTKVHLLQLAGQIAESVMNRDSFYDEVYHMLRNGSGVQIIKDMTDYYDDLNRKCDSIRRDYMFDKITSYLNKGSVHVDHSTSFEYKLNDRVHVIGDIKFELNKGGKTYNVKWFSTNYDGTQIWKKEIRSKVEHVRNFISQCIQYEEDAIFNNDKVNQIPEEYK